MLCPECGNEWQQRGFRFCPYDGARLKTALKQRGAKAAEDAGTIIAGRYVIRQFLARGAMARIYSADDERTGQMVAVKILDKHKARDAEVRQRFAREANALRMIEHDNIIKIYEVGERDDGTPYLVMEFLRGESLGERFEVEPTLDRELALAIVRQTCEALWAAHQQGIVHRDIKPDNLFLVGDPRQAASAMGQPKSSVRVLDFGLSRVFNSKLTAAGTVIGTPGYMAPEQVVADPVDQRSDVYGLGMVMYRMFTGRLPFEADDNVVILAKQLFATPAPPSEHVPGLDPSVERVILRAIRKQPEHRYPSMLLFNEDVKKLQAGREVPRMDAPRDKYELSSTHAQMVANGYRQLLAKLERAE